MILWLLAACQPLSNQVGVGAWTAPTLVVEHPSEEEDSFGICQLLDEGWRCARQRAPALAGSLYQDHLFQAIDGDGDGAQGFMLYGETSALCEPSLEGWRCAQIPPVVNRVQRVDLDGDGLEDLALADPNFGGYRCLAGTSPMACGDAGPLAGAGYRAVAWADYSGDGLLDVFGAFERPWDQGVSALCLDGAEGWACEDFDLVSLTARGLNSDAVAFDANLDGAMDLYLAGGVDYMGEHALCLNQGGGAFECAAVDLVDMYRGGQPLGDSSVDVKVADLDLDGADDLVMHSLAEASVCWSDARGGLDCAPLDADAALEIDAVWGYTNQVDVGDLDGDGWPDVVASGVAAGEGVRVCWNLGGRRFSCEEVLAQSHSSGVAILQAY